jgi:hypothetical protein
MSKFNNSGLIGLDVKPRRKLLRFQQNRYIQHTSKWLLPVILSLATLGIIAIAGGR